ncbi:hypothetical protein [Cupriavidus sp. TMH.W2]|uniref:hypothetical protein n=1 Tax=Cupriavidus sp. TMH.W2 TaxID=3434465 RepID=UPI003D7764F3
MKITSTLKDQRSFSETYVVLDTTTPFGKFHVGIGVGALESKNLFLTEVGKAAFDRMTELARSKEGKLHLVHVASTFKAKKLVPGSLMAAKPGDSIFFVCKDSPVYDVVSAQLSFTNSPAPVAVS